MMGALPLLQTLGVFILKEAVFPITEATTISQHSLPSLPVIRDHPVAVLLTSDV